MATQILVPLDGSSLAEQALSCAVMLGRGLPAELVLLRAVFIPFDVQGALVQAGRRVDALAEHLEAEAHGYLRGIAGSLAEAGSRVRCIVLHGPAAEAIVDYAEEMGIQQIVMATHGYAGLKRWTHGSVAERVLQAASVPVLLVRAQERDVGDSQPLTLCRRILVPLDGSELAEQILPAVTPMAQALGAKLMLFRVLTARVTGWGTGTGEWFPPLNAFEIAEHEAQASLDRVASRLEELGIRVSTATQMGEAADSIIRYAEANNADLIAMCTHGRTGLARWALGSVADRVLRAGGIPILLVRAK